MQATIRKGIKTWEVLAPAIGPDWMPLPLTSAASVDQVKAHINRLNPAWVVTEAK